MKKGTGTVKQMAVVGALFGFKQRFADLTNSVRRIL